jgi:hypothetical protein
MREGKPGVGERDLEMGEGKPGKGERESQGWERVI